MRWTCRPKRRRSHCEFRRSRAALPRPGFTLVELLVVIAIVGLLVAILLPAIQAARETAQRAGCTNNLRQIGLAMATYHDAATTLPAAVSDTWAGSIHLHTWAVFLLPYLEEGNLVERYDFAAGQNAAVNMPIVSRQLSIYSCPSSDGAFYEGDGHYARRLRGGQRRGTGEQRRADLSGVACTISADCRRSGQNVAGGRTVLPQPGLVRGSAANTTGGGGGGGAAFSRGVSRWWSCNSPCAVPGINPPKTTCNNFCEQRFQFSSAHAQGVYFLYCDGHVEFIDETIEPERLQALMTIAGDEIAQTEAGE